MKQRPRIYYTEAQKALMWERWKATGQDLSYQDRKAHPSSQGGNSL